MTEAEAVRTRDETVAALVEQLYPTTSWGPGARELDIATVVRSLVHSPAGQGADSYRQPPFVEATDSGHGWQWQATFEEGFDHGLDVIEHWSRQTHGRPFHQLDEADQEGAVAALEAGELPGFSVIPARAFFDLLTGYVFDALFVAPTVGGYSMDKVWNRLGIGTSGR